MEGTENKVLPLTSGLASSFLHPQPDSCHPINSIKALKGRVPIEQKLWRLLPDVLTVTKTTPGKLWQLTTEINRFLTDYICSFFNQNTDESLNFC